jgi:hypothetical protein
VLGVLALCDDAAKNNSVHDQFGGFAQSRALPPAPVLTEEACGGKAGLRTASRGRAVSFYDPMLLFRSLPRLPAGHQSVSLMSPVAGDWLLPRRLACCCLGWWSGASTHHSCLWLRARACCEAATVAPSKQHRHETRLFPTNTATCFPPPTCNRHR